MNKVIVAFDGQHFSAGAMKMAQWLNKKTPILVSGVFISPVDYRELLGYSGMGVGAPVFTVPYDNDDRLVEETMNKFVHYCEENKLEFVTHKDTDLFALAELIQETRFADVLIISSEMFYENIDKDQPNDYLRKVLHESECPVLLVPEGFAEPTSILLSYDGKASSVYAIKQFAYLFPLCCNLGTMLFHAHGSEIPQAGRLKELVERHFDPIDIEQLNEEDAAALHDWMLDNRHAILVSGAFGRGELSSLFRKSYITDVIRAHKIPVFIAHK
jgi:hypothetical protein